MVKEVLLTVYDTIQFVKQHPTGEGGNRFTVEKAQKAREFHQSFPEYCPTPLVNLQRLAARLGVAEFRVKDESARFGLNAFKVLGGSYAIGQYIAETLGTSKELRYDQLVCEETREKLQNLTFITATDGNHGRGVAWTASRLGCQSVVYMPAGSARERLENIRALGAKAEITDLDYDDTVRLACKEAKEKGWALIQDTSWEGYEEVPAWIMEGYTTMALEAAEQLGDCPPTHIFLQAGVGALAGALAGFFGDYYRECPPVIVIVEPSQAACLFQTVQAADGQLHKANGSMQTIMAGLCCGEPCGLGWQQLQAYASYFLSVPDWVAAQGMRVLGNPLPGDTRIISGESGAVTVGAATQILTRGSLASLRQDLGLGPDSRILCFSTEGDTDRENYRRIVWDGAWPAL